MSEQDLKVMIDNVKNKMESKFEVKNLEYLLDFDSVSVMVSMSYN